MSSAHIAVSLLAEIVERAAASPTQEVCGLLLGTADRITSAPAAANVAAVPARMFEIEPAALFAVLRAERVGGSRVLGCYHSHPNGSAAPSPRDAAAAEPGKLWLILGGGQARLWRATGGGFVEVELIAE